jgi:hypothetical protein
MIVAYFWTIKPSRFLQAIHAIGFDRFRLILDKNLSFHKSFGTGKGETFTPNRFPLMVNGQVENCLLHLQRIWVDRLL